MRRSPASRPSPIEGADDALTGTGATDDLEANPMSPAGGGRLPAPAARRRRRFSLMKQVS